MRKLLIILVFASTKALATLPLSKSYRAGWSQTQLFFDSYQSVGNYDSEGKLSSLPTNSFWETSTSAASTRYVLDSKWAASATLKYVRALSNVGSSSKMNQGMQTLDAGVEYRFDNQFADFILEGVGQVSLFRVDPNSTAPLYGDGVHALGGNLWILQKFSSLQWQARAGYLYRTEGLSSLLPYHLGIFWRPGSLAFGASLEGAVSLIADKETDVSRHSLLARSNGGSLNYRSANPNINTLDFHVRWSPTSQFTLWGGAGEDIMGRNTSQGRHFFIGIEILWQVAQAMIEKSPFQNTVEPVEKTGVSPQKKKAKTTPLFKEEDYQQELKEKDF